MRFSLPSFAKINWNLRVLGKRPDGFHELCTVFQTISLHDTLEFSEAEHVTTVDCDSPGLAGALDNLVLSTARALSRRYPETRGASIYLRKRIPFPGGLGGGSSNAAVALIGLTRLWNLKVDDRELSSIGAELGSDVPFFLSGGTGSGTGRGEIVEPIDDISAENMLVVTPNVKVSTAEAYAAIAAPPLTSDDQESNLTVCRKAAEALDPLRSELINDFERSVFAAYPEIKRVKETLLELGAANAAMSGSGASVFAVFDKEETRQAAEKALDSESTWRKFAVSTISRTEYREALGL